VSHVRQLLRFNIVANGLVVGQIRQEQGIAERMQVTLRGEVGKAATRGRLGGQARVKVEHNSLQKRSGQSLANLQLFLPETSDTMIDVLNKCRYNMAKTKQKIP
jgi:hypothetical protein